MTLIVLLGCTSYEALQTCLYSSNKLSTWSKQDNVTSMIAPTSLLRSRHASEDFHISHLFTIRLSQTVNRYLLRHSRHFRDIGLPTSFLAGAVWLRPPPSRHASFPASAYVERPPFLLPHCFSSLPPCLCLLICFSSGSLLPFHPFPKHPTPRYSPGYRRRVVRAAEHFALVPVYLEWTSCRGATLLYSSARELPVPSLDPPTSA